MCTKFQQHVYQSFSRFSLDMEFDAHDFVVSGDVSTTVAWTCSGQLGFDTMCASEFE